MPANKRFSYQALGLIIKSKNLEIPELIEIDDQAHSSYVNITEDDSLVPPKLPANFADNFYLKKIDNQLWLIVKNVGVFQINDGKFITWKRWHQDVGDQTIRNCLLGVGLGALSNQHGNLTLHGSALEKDGSTIICMGHSGAGKSTTAYILMMQGWKLLADDLVAVSRDGRILPCIPRIKLCKDAIEKAKIDPNTIKLFGTTEKYVLNKKFVNYALQPAPLKTIYILDGRNQSNTVGKITRIKNQKTKLLYLRQHVFWKYLVEAMELEGRYFIDSVKLLKHAPMYILSPPNGIRETQKWLLTQNLLMPGKSID
jgi:hypothetical protein